MRRSERRRETLRNGHLDEEVLDDEARQRGDVFQHGGHGEDGRVLDRLVFYCQRVQKGFHGALVGQHLPATGFLGRTLGRFRLGFVLERFARHQQRVTKVNPNQHSFELSMPGHLIRFTWSNSFGHDA